MKYLFSFFRLGSLCLVLLAILSIEQVYGLPILFLSLSVLWLEKRNQWRQLAFGLLLGLTLATVYTFAYSLGFLIVIGCVWVFQHLQLRLASQTGALLLTSLGGGVLCGVLSATTFSWSLVLSCLVSVGVSVFFSKITLTHHSKRYHL